MGINTPWKSQLRKLFPTAWLRDLSNHLEIDTIIDDLSLNSYKVCSNVKTGEDIQKELQKRLNRYWTLKLERYIVLLDDEKWVPLSKQPKQIERRLKNGLSPIKDEDITDSLRITHGILPNIQKVLETPELLNDLYRYMSECITKQIKFPHDNVDIIISTGKINCRLNPPTTRIHCIYHPMKVDHIHNASKYKNNKLITNTKFMRTTHLTDSVRIIKEKKSFIKYELPYTIGEADLKVVTEISNLYKQGKKNIKVHIRNHDTDAIPILLLAMRDWIDPETHMIGPEIFLNTSPEIRITKGSNDRHYFHGKDYSSDPAKHPNSNRRDFFGEDVNEIIHMNELWRQIITLFRNKYPTIENPIETMVLLMLLTGCDYIIKTFHRIGPVVLWDAFDEGGWKIFAGKENEKQTVEIDLDERLLPDGTYTNVFGDPDRQHNIKITEYKVYNFMRYVYSVNIINPAVKPTEIEVLDTMDKIRNVNNGRLRRDVFWKIPSDNEMLAIIRRIYWVMFYWINGPKGIDINLYPVQVDPLSGLSLYGWEEIEGFTKDGKPCLFIAEADRVHIFNSIE